MPKGLVWFTPPSRGFVGQGRCAKKPNGNLTSSQLAEAVQMNGMVTVAAMVCWLLDVRFVIEQPALSWLTKTDPLDMFLKYIGAHKPIVHTCTGSYGSDDSVQIKLWGTWHAASTLGRRTASWGKRSSLVWERPESLGIAVKQVFVILYSPTMVPGSESTNRAGFGQDCYKENGSCCSGPTKRKPTLLFTT